MATAGSQLHSIQADLSESEYEDMQTCRVTRNSSHCSSNSRSIAGTNRTVVPITYKCTTRLRKHRLERDFASNFDVGSSGCKSSSPQSLINDRKVYILKESHCLKGTNARAWFWTVNWIDFHWWWWYIYIYIYIMYAYVCMYLSLLSQMKWQI